MDGARPYPQLPAAHGTGWLGRQRAHIAGAGGERRGRGKHPACTGLPTAGPERNGNRRLLQERNDMAELTYRQAVAAGLAQEIERDPTVMLIGEDVGAAGGVFKATEGLLERLGPSRGWDT